MEIISDTIDSHLTYGHFDTINSEDPKIILITSRLKENVYYKPAEEILLEIVSLSSGLKFEIIECDLYETNNFFGRPPVLYFNGKVITNQNIFHFLRDFMINHNKDHGHVDRHEISHHENSLAIQRKNLLFDNLIGVLRDQLRFANEFYFYLKMKEKLEKNQNRKIFFSFFSSLFKVKIDSSAYEQISETVLNNFPQISKREYSNLITEEKLSYLIKEAYGKLNKIIKDKESHLGLNQQEFLTTEEEKFFDFVFFSFLKEDKLLFSSSEISRPILDYMNHIEEENFSNVAKYFTKIEEEIKLIVPSKIVKISSHHFNFAKNYSLAINPSNKKVKNIQEMEVTRSLHHNLFSIGVFSVTALILLYISTRKK
jgi:hypothetical protein